MGKSIKFKNINNQFQNNLKEVINKINKSSEAFVKCKNSNNIYKMSPRIQRKVLSGKITKFYKKAPDNQENNINSKARSISHNLNRDDKMEILCKKQVLFKLKFVLNNLILNV